MTKLIAAVTMLLLSTQAFADIPDISIAVSNNNLAKVKSLIESGQATKDDFVPSNGYPSGAPLIALAAQGGSVEVAEYLISLKANLNAKTSFNETALQLACFFDSDLNGGTSGNFERNDKIAHDLVDAGADLENPGQFSPLTYGAYKGRIAIMTFLLSKGAKVDSDAANGKIATDTALMFASMTGYTNVVRMLLQHDADPRIVNAKGRDAQYFAQTYSQTQVMPLIQCALDLKPGEKYSDHCTM